MAEQAGDTRGGSSTYAGVGAVFAVGDEAYGINPVLRARLQQRRLSYVLAIARTTPVILGTGKTTAETALGQVPGAAWQTRSAGAGAKGLRRYDWAWVDLEPEGGGALGFWPAATERPARSPIT